MASVSFDRIADRYDETRGGLARGAGLAREIAVHLRPGPAVEIGVGTGAVALPLIEVGHPLVGVDLSEPMLRRAHERLGSRLAIADGYHLPVRDAATPNAAIVWVLQLVPDIAGFLAETTRVLAPGGRLVVVPAGGHWDDDDMAPIIKAMGETLRPSRDRGDSLIGAARSAGLALVGEHETGSAEWLSSPENQARHIEARTWSSLWGLSDERWAAVVAPALAALRALPDPGRPRRRRTHYELVVFERP
jgi:SAM-dependent methyltransferase